MYASFLNESCIHQARWGFLSIFWEENGDFGPTSRERDVTEAN